MTGFGTLPQRQWREWRKPLFEQRGYKPWIIPDFGDDIELYDHFNIEQMAGGKWIDQKTALSRMIETRVYTFVDLDRPKITVRIRYNAEADEKEYNLDIFLNWKGKIIDVVTASEWNSGARAQSVWSSHGEPHPEAVDWVVKAASMIANRCYELHRQAQVDSEPNRDSTRER